MVQTVMGEESGEYLVGTDQIPDDATGSLAGFQAWQNNAAKYGVHAGAPITDATLDQEANLLAVVMLNLGHIGNAGTYLGLPRGQGLANQALQSRPGSPLCIMLTRAINAVDFAVTHPNASTYTQWRGIVQGGFIRDLNSQGPGYRIAGTDFF